MFKLMPLCEEAIPAAIEKARCYRYLNEAVEAESICLDILDIEPQNQQALVMLLLSLTDQFEHQLNPAFTKARDVLPRLQDKYSRAYYNGIICERRAKSHLQRGGPGSGRMAYEWFRQAMDSYQEAIDIRLHGNDDAILRWNTCARILIRNPDVVPAEAETGESMLE